MGKYNFYYDETEHSRIINYTTVCAENYYDSFIAGIVGWKSEDEENICNKYAAFEEKFSSRKDKNGEIKSRTFRQSQFKYGFASMNPPNAQMLDAFLSVWDENMHLYFLVRSKVEYLIDQIFSKYHNTWYANYDNMRYSLIKAINVYRPKELIECIYGEPHQFKEALIGFLKSRIEIDKSNKTLKQAEIDAFQEAIKLLEDTEVPQLLSWDYQVTFEGFLKYLREENISNYSLLLDKEGEADEDSNTLIAANNAGVSEVKEGDSKDYIGLRMADMIAGILAKMMKAVSEALMPKQTTAVPIKTILSKEWFDLSEAQLNLYKKLYKIICVWDDAWYKSYAGKYSDDLIVFIALLAYMNQFKSAEMLKKQLSKNGEYFNTFSTAMLRDYFERLGKNMPIEYVPRGNGEYFLNSKGGKVFYNSEKQPKLRIPASGIIEEVQSVGITSSGIPLVTIFKKGKMLCYRLPDDLMGWAAHLTAIASTGEKMFPCRVRFLWRDGKYFADLR